MNGEIKQKEFCRLTGLTRKALLIYEEKGVLIPSRIDDSTGYRFYSEHEVDRGIRIAHLRTMEFNVADIAMIINRQPETASLFVVKEKELIRQRHIIDQSLRSMDLHRTTTMFNADIQESKLTLYQVATIEGRGTIRDLTVHLKLLLRHVHQYGVTESGPTGTYFFADSTLEEMHFKVFVPVPGEWLTPPNGFLVESFGIPKFTFLRHYGSYELIPSTYALLLKLLANRGDIVTGELMEIYHISPTSLSGSDTTMLITDIGVPQWH